MSTNGKAEQKAEQEQIRRNLEGILASDNLPIMPHSEITEKIQHPDTRTMNFYTVKEESFDEAEDTIDAMIEFYLDPTLEKKPHVKRKKKADIISLMHIFFQLKTQQHAVIKLMEEIDMGNMNTKLFEVLERMQGRLESLTKSQLMYRHALEESYKKVKEDDLRMEATRPKNVNGIDIEHAGGETRIVAGEGFKSRGTKNIIDSLETESGGKGSLDDSAGKVDARVRPLNPHPDEEKIIDVIEHVSDDMFNPMSNQS
jgi:hypothetical protein